MFENIMLYILACIGLLFLFFTIIFLSVNYSNETNKYSFDKNRKQWIITMIMKLNINKPKKIYKLVKLLGEKDIKFLSKYCENCGESIGEKICVVLDYSLIYKEGDFE